MGPSESPNGFEVQKRKGVSYTFTKAKTILIEMEGGPLRYIEGALHASHGTQVYKCIQEPTGCLSETKSTAEFTPDGDIQVTTNLGRRTVVYRLIKQVSSTPPTSAQNATSRPMDA